MSQDPWRTLATEDGLDGASLLLRALIDDLPDQVYLKDTEGRYLFNNAKHLKALGAASPEEAAGKSDFDFYPKKLAERYRADETEVTRSGRPLICNEEPSVDGEGNERWHLTMKVPLRRADGEIVGLVGITRDVTDRKEAEEALKESEARFRQLFERSTDALFVHDEDGRIVDCNAEACRSLGYTRDELLGLSVESFSADAPAKEEKGARKDDTPWMRAMASEPGIVVGYHETKHRRKDGTTFPVQVGIGAIDYGGRRLIFASARDLTERKEAEEKLRESEERFRTVFEDAPIGVALVGLDGRRFRVNQALCEMLGYSEEDLCSEKYLEHIHPADREISSKHRRETLEKGEGSYTLERRYIHADGHTVWNLTNVSLIQDSEGNPSHLVCLHQDITERKEMETKLRKSEARLAEAQRIACLGNWEWDVKTGEVFWSDEIFRIYGFEPKEFVPTLDKLMELVHPDDRELVRKNIDAVLYGGESYDFEHRIVRPDGEERVVHRQAEVIFDEEDEPLRIIGTLLDMTERKRAEEKIRESEERYRAVVEQSAEAIWLFDPDTKRVLESNTAFQEMLGYTAEELQEMTNYDFVAHSREDIDSAVRRVVQERRGFFGEREYRRKDGTVLDVEVSGSVIPYQGEEVVCGVARDLTERKELEEQLRHQAFHDALTGLPNRSLFLDRLGHALARAKREGGPVAVLLMDLNDFKVINDSLGHDAGNAVLVEVAKRLRGCLRPGDTAGRIFGDEFAVLLEAPSGMEKASRVAERLQEGLQAPFDVDGQEVFVSPSIGIALGESHADRSEEVLRHADLAMYEAKRRGRAEYEVYNPSMNTRAVNRMDLENELRGAIEREEFEVHYQPVIELETGKIAGFEALARWKHPERGLVEAEEFIELAEQTGLIRPIGQGVLEEACWQAKEWGERYPDGVPWMSVNFSASQFSRQPDLIPKVLDETGLDPNVLQIEITERAVMDNAEYSIGKLKKLKGMGVSFAIDDFGMGYSCLYYLKRMPVDFLKIDRSFIAGLGKGDPGDESIVSGTIGLAHALGLKVVAEGVEAEEQLAKLKELGCDLGQGYHFAEPLPGEEAERLLKRSVSC